MAATEEGEDELFPRVTRLAQRRDYAGALAYCNTYLERQPADRCALTLRERMQEALTTSAERSAAASVETAAPSFAELEEQARQALPRAFEAVFRELEDDDLLWRMGEQAVGIFADPWQLSARGTEAAGCAADIPLRERLHEMSRSLLERLLRRVRTSRWLDGGDDFDLPEHCTFDHWIYEAAGLLWWQAELGLELDAELLAATRVEWMRLAADGKLQGCRNATELAAQPLSELFTRLMEVWMLERCLVCSLFGEDAPPPLECGLGDVLAEVRKRPLAEPRSADLYDGFYLLTHVIFVMNCYGGCLPNHRADCCWIYDYVEELLAFFLREGKYYKDGDYYSLRMDPQQFGEDAVDTVAEAVDILRGLGGGAAQSPLVIDAISFLIHQQGEDGLFQPPGGMTSEMDFYDRLHPSWAAVSALQLDRREGVGSAHTAAWAEHARREAARVGFAEPPPPAWAVSSKAVASCRNLVDLLRSDSESS